MKTDLENRLLLVLPILAYRHNRRVYIDDQACNGARLWLANFAKIIFAAPTIEGKPPPGRSPIDEVLGSERLQFVALPPAYTPTRFAKELPATLRLIAGLIDQSDYLHFAIGGIWGDWGSAGSLVAFFKGRRYAIWTDRVESKVCAFHAESQSGLKRLYWRINATLMIPYERAVIKRSHLGLFHGMDCYDAYARYSKQPQLVHDIHLGPTHTISDAELKERYSSWNGTLRIVYAGRADREKGVFDWIETLKLAHQAGTKVDATWYGAGIDREEAIERARGLPIQFPGLLLEHRELLNKLKKADLFLFCHKTPESPRCLIEALICGLPIVGYDSPYPRDLISKCGGGRLTEANDPNSLAEALKGFDMDRRSLTKAAMRDGARFSDELVFRHRSELIKSLGSYA